MSRRRAAHRLRGGAGRPLRLAVRIVGAHGDGNGLAGDDRARHPLDQRRHGRRPARGGAQGIDGAAAPGGGNPPQGHLAHRSRRLSLLAVAAGILDPLGLRRPHPFNRHRRGRERCICDRRNAARGGARMSRRACRARRGARRARVHRSCPDRVPHPRLHLPLIAAARHDRSRQ